jgi:O-antigen ligase
VIFVATAFVLLSGPASVPLDRVAIGLGVVAIALSAHQGRIGQIAVPPIAGVFLLWLAQSTAWSEYPSQTVQEVVSLCAVTVAGFAAGSCCQERDLVRGLSAGAYVVGGLSVAVAVAFPAVGLVTDDYQTNALQGIYIHRNILSYTLATGIIAALAGLLLDPDRRPRRVLFVAGLVVLIAATRSSTPFAVLLFALAATGLLILVKRCPPGQRIGRGVVGAAAITAGVYVVFANLASAVELAGRDLTFTGRTDIWAAVWAASERRPISGYGWNAVWMDGNDVGDMIRRQIGFSVNHAHNAYLDTLVQGGTVGLLLLVGLLLYAAVRAVRCYLAAVNHTNLWFVATIVMFVLYNLLETRVTRPFGWFILAIGLSLITRESASLRTRRARGRPPVAATRVGAS